MACSTNTATSVRAQGYGPLTGSRLKRTQQREPQALGHAATLPLHKQTFDPAPVMSVEAVWELEDLGNERTLASCPFDADLGRVLGLVIRGPVLAATRAIFVDGRPGELARGVEGG